MLYAYTAKLKPYTYGGSAHIECPASTWLQEYYMICEPLRECFIYVELNRQPSWSQWLKGEIPVDSFWLQLEHLSSTDD